MKPIFLEDGKHIVPDIMSSIKHRLGLYNLTKEDFVGSGMGSPGAVDRNLKTVTGAFNLNWAATQEVGTIIEAELGIPFTIDNDANVAPWRTPGLVRVIIILMLSL